MVLSVVHSDPTPAGCYSDLVFGLSEPVEPQPLSRDGDRRSTTEGRRYDVSVGGMRGRYDVSVRGGGMRGSCSNQCQGCPGSVNRITNQGTVLPGRTEMAGTQDSVSLPGVSLLL